MSKQARYVIFGIAGFGLLVMVGCCGFFYWGWTLLKDQVQDALNRNAVIQQHVGEVERVELDFGATSEAGEEGVFVYRVYGAKGSGTVTAEFVAVDGETQEIRSGTLELDSGETFDLLENPQPAMDGVPERVPEVN